MARDNDGVYLDFARFLEKSNAAHAMPTPHDIWSALRGRIRLIGGPLTGTVGAYLDYAEHSDDAIVKVLARAAQQDLELYVNALSEYTARARIVMQLTRNCTITDLRSDPKMRHLWITCPNTTAACSIAYPANASLEFYFAKEADPNRPDDKLLKLLADVQHALRPEIRDAASGLREEAKQPEQPAPMQVVPDVLPAAAPRLDSNDNNNNNNNNNNHNNGRRPARRRFH